jgi:small subunit ribosomal protein S9
MAKDTQYHEAVGRRKTAVARVRLFSAKDLKEHTVNEQKLTGYFNTETLQNIALEALQGEGKGEFMLSAHVSGGGTNSQAEAIRLGVSRALIKFNEELRGDLKKQGFLKRDPRTKERKKFGLKKARKSPQWSKR